MEELRAVEGRHRARDLCVVVVLLVVSALPYLGGLGFYSDDWEFLAGFAQAEDSSLSGLYRAIDNPIERMRPLKILYQAALYQLFGPRPLPYHLVNHLVVILNAALLYLVMTCVARRQVALAAALVFALAPHHATTRFWFASFQAQLSIAFYLLTLLADLATTRARACRAVLLQLAATACLVVCGLSYEVALPLALLNVLAMRRQGATRVRTAAVLSLRAVVLSALVAFKLATTVRLPVSSHPSAYLHWLSGYLARAFDLGAPPPAEGFHLAESLRIAFVDLGLLLPSNAVALLMSHPSAAVAVVALAVGLGAAIVLFVIARSEEWLQPRTWGGIAAWGVAAFLLGWAIFLFNPAVVLTPTGIGNRTAIAASLGVALLVVAGAGAVASFMPSRWRRVALSLLVGGYCGAETVVVGCLGHAWGQAASEQRSIVAELAPVTSSLPAGSTLLLTGFCRYRGPAIVFEASWDLAAALAVAYGDRAPMAEVVSAETEVLPDGIQTSYYRETLVYPYGELWIYHRADRALCRLGSAEEAHRFLASHGTEPGRGCPPGRIGAGVEVLWSRGGGSPFVGSPPLW